MKSLLTVLFIFALVPNTLQFNITEFGNKILQKMLDGVISKAADIPEKMSKGAKKILDDFAKAKLKEPETSIKLSGQLKTLISVCLLVIEKMEKGTLALKSVLRSLKFWLKQEHNALKYKLESSVLGMSYDFYARANFAFTG